MATKIYKKENKDESDSESRLINDVKNYGDVVGIVEYYFVKKILNNNMRDIIIVHYDGTKYTMISTFTRLFFSPYRFLLFLKNERGIKITSNTLNKTHLNRIKNQAGAEAL